MRPLLRAERRTTSRMISARAATANTGGPLRVSVRRAAAAAGSDARARANAARTLSIARCCASVSEPSARVWSRSSAAAPSRELHTPSSVRGARSGPKASTIVSSSPVGSWVKSGFTSGPSGEASTSSEAAMAACSPAAEKRCALTAGLRR